MIPSKTNSITCPKCGELIPLQEAMEMQLQSEISEKLKAEQERMNINAQEIIRSSEERIRKELETKQAAESSKQLEELERLKLEQQASRDLLRKQDEEKQKLQEQINQKVDELARKELSLAEERKNLSIENEKKLDEDRKRVEEETKKRIQDENTLHDAEIAVQMESLRKEAADYRRKLESTSQQLIGEGQEIALEDALRMAFPNDLIEPVQKGMKGADCIQKVRSNGNIVGIIVWESKRTKAWLNEWTGKLKDDMRTLNATLAILVTQTLPSDMTIKAGLHDGVWVTDFPTAIPMATALRAGILSVASVQTLANGSDEKSQKLFTYITSSEFRGNMQAVIETYAAFQNDLAAEKRAAEKQWKKREVTITRALTATNRIYGSLQGMLGDKSMPELEVDEQKQIEA